jgi:NADPH:quinone reductase-like Zn-dependent oxidoreductase
LKRGRSRSVADAGVELVLDAVGRDSLKKGYRLLAPRSGCLAAATNNTGGMFGMLSTLASTPWLHFNPLSVMNANRKVFGVNWGVRVVP